MAQEPFPPEDLDKALDYFLSLFPSASFVIIAHDPKTGISRPVTNLMPESAIALTADLLQHMRDTPAIQTGEGKTH